MSLWHDLVMTSPVPVVSVPNVPDSAVLLDVRENDEWAAGHAPGAVHVVCRSGARSARVTAYLTQAGWDAVNVDGGMQAWAAAGRPMVAESSTAPKVL